MISLRNGHGVELWQERMDVWMMLHSDYRCYEMCFRYVIVKSVLQDEMLMNVPVLMRSTLYSYAAISALLWDTVLQDKISSLSENKGIDVLRGAITKLCNDIKEAIKTMAKKLEKA